MAKKDYSEDLLIQAPTAELLEKKLGWTTVFAQDEGDFGPDRLLGRASEREVLAALKRLNSGLPEEAYHQALAQVVQEDITKTLVQMNEEKYRLLRDGVPVKYRSLHHFLSRRTFSGFFVSPLQATAGTAPRNCLLSASQFSAPITAIFRPVLFSVLCVSLERSRDSMQQPCGFQGVGL